MRKKREKNVKKKRSIPSILQNLKCYKIKFENFLLRFAKKTKKKRNDKDQ